MIFILEQLENRLVPAVSVMLNNGILTVNGDNRDNFVSISFDVNNNVIVVADGQRTQFATGTVNAIRSDLNRGDDYFQNLTNINETVQAGDGNDYVKSGAGDSQIWGENGRDILQEFIGGGSNTLMGNEGNDQLWGGAGAADLLLGGDDVDVIYDIVGGLNRSNGGDGQDSIIVRQTDMNIMDNRDTTVLFGLRNGTVVLDNGVVYISTGANNDRVVAFERGNTFNVSVNGQVSSFYKRDVKHIAGLLGDGDDIFVNRSTVASVIYSTNGNDMLIGGSNFDLFKGGAGNDVLIGNGGMDDLSGDGDADTLISSNDGRDIIRADAADQVYASNNDIVLGLRRS